jgi:hypothetical protein
VYMFFLGTLYIYIYIYIYIYSYVLLGSFLSDVTSVLCHATMQMDGLSATPHNNAYTLVVIFIVTRAVVQHYVCNNVHVEERF